jgi:mannose-1-phosphate guanylyltransferase
VATAFLPGAGLGTRLQPLTSLLPKPLVPVMNKPVIAHAMDHLLEAGVRRFVVNTHHLPACYRSVFGGDGHRAEYRGCGMLFIHEPVLLETGGGIRNARHLIGDEPFIVYNGDILADFALEPLLERHAEGSPLATLALRAGGKGIRFDQDSGAVLDLRGLLGAMAGVDFGFTGVSVMSPGIFDLIPDGRIVSFIPILAAHVRDGGAVGGVEVHPSPWLDVGDPAAYLEAHRVLAAGDLTSSRFGRGLPAAIAPSADVDPSAILRGCTTAGAGSSIGPDAVLDDVVVWPGVAVPARSVLSSCVVTGHSTVQCGCRPPTGTA